MTKEEYFKKDIAKNKEEFSKLLKEKLIIIFETQYKEKLEAYHKYEGLPNNAEAFVMALLTLDSFQNAVANYFDSQEISIYDAWAVLEDFFYDYDALSEEDLDKIKKVIQR